MKPFLCPLNEHTYSLKSLFLRLYLSYFLTFFFPAPDCGIYAKSLGSKSWLSHNFSFGEKFSSLPSMLSLFTLSFLHPFPSFPFQSSFLFLHFCYLLFFIWQNLLHSQKQIKVGTNTDIDDTWRKLRLEWTFSEWTLRMIFHIIHHKETSTD